MRAGVRLWEGLACTSGCFYFYARFFHFLHHKTQFMDEVGFSCISLPFLPFVHWLFSLHSHIEELTYLNKKTNYFVFVLSEFGGVCI